MRVFEDGPIQAATQAAAVAAFRYSDWDSVARREGHQAHGRRRVRIRRGQLPQISLITFGIRRSKRQTPFEDKELPRYNSRTSQKALQQCLKPLRIATRA